MCGLVGIYATRGGQVDRDVLARMNDSQHHRGPDETGLHVEPGIGLGHKRLAIIDLAEGQQPLANEDGSVIVVFNGEIYNYRELGERLRTAGHRFRTQSDTEVIVHAWEEWGEDCVREFRGMFAFAIWDRNRQTLFLARDRLGIKPLYYAWVGDRELVFGSELKALRQHPAFNRTIDPYAVEEYFAFGYVPEPRTIHRGSYKLAPGHTLCVRPGLDAPQPREYWDIPFQAHAPMSLQQAEGELVERLREAVRIRLVAEVPLGAFLSGGVDSSSVVALMAGLDDKPVNTCSIAFGEAEFNEAAYAAQVAERYRTHHRVEQVDPNDYSLLDGLAALYDEPFADSSAIPTYRVCQLARREVTVALSGDGGDENLAGYKRYGWLLGDLERKEGMPVALRNMAAGLGKLYPHLTVAPRQLQLRQGLLSLGDDMVATFCELNAVIKQDQRLRLYSSAFRRQLQGYQAVAVFRRHAAHAPVDDPLALAQYLDMKAYLPGDILTKVDRASMAHALEVRVPLLDHQLVEWISGLPNDFKRRAGEGKYLLKKAMEPYLPEDILYRPKKGFAVPLAQWFRGPLRKHVEQVVLGDTLAASGIFERRALAGMLDEHQSGRRDWSAALWAIVMFEAFLRLE